VEEIRSIDLAAAVILGIAALRGVFRGLFREALSIGGLAAACIVVRIGTAPGAAWLVETTGGEVGPTAAPWIVGAVLGIAVLVAATFVGRTLRQGAKAAGLGWADHTGGAVLGAAEGALVAVILLLLVSSVIGRDAELLEDTYSLTALERIEGIVSENDLRVPDVAAPPRR
jgi:membrane protein required for colicin V production